MRPARRAWPARPPGPLVGAWRLVGVVTGSRDPSSLEQSRAQVKLFPLGRPWPPHPAPLGSATAPGGGIPHLPAPGLRAWAPGSLPPGSGPSWGAARRIMKFKPPCSDKRRTCPRRDAVNQGRASLPLSVVIFRRPTDKDEQEKVLEEKKEFGRLPTPRRVLRQFSRPGMVARWRCGGGEGK